MMLMEIRKVDGSCLTFLDAVNVGVIASLISAKSGILSFALEAVRFVSGDRFSRRANGIRVDSLAWFLHITNKN